MVRHQHADGYDPEVFPCREGLDFALLGCFKSFSLQAEQDRNAWSV